MEERPSVIGSYSESRYLIFCFHETFLSEAKHLDVVCRCNRRRIFYFPFILVKAIF